MVCAASHRTVRQSPVSKPQYELEQLALLTTRMKADDTVESGLRPLETDRRQQQPAELFDRWA